MSLDRPTRSIRQKQMDQRTSTDRLRDKGRSSHATNLTNTKNLYDKCIFNLVRRNFITDLIHLIGSTSPKFDV